MRVVEAADCHLTAEEVHRRLRRGRRPIGLATVYRTLDLFVREGLVERAHVGDGKVRYGLAARHHDHLVCLACGEWEPIKDCLVSRPPRRMAGFRVTGHQLELYGVCADCQAAGA
jgi:Fur family ferric uptake transcriptional regulator